MIKIFRSLVKILDYPINGLHFLNVYVCLPTILLLVLLDIVIRTFLNVSLSWGHEVLGLILLCGFFLSLPKCLANNELLRVEWLYEQLSGLWKQLLYRLVLLIIGGFAVLVVWQGIVSTRDMYEFQDRAFTVAIPYWPFSLLVACVGALMTLQCLLAIALGPGEEDQQVPRNHAEKDHVS